MCDSYNHTKELIEQAHRGDKEARNRLVTENMGLIWSIVKRFTGRGHELEDLFQIGSIGLIKAIDKFDTSYDVRFSTYAVPMITGEVKRFLRDDGMIKVSRSLKEIVVKVQRAREQLQKEIGEEPSMEMIARAIDVPEEDIVMALEAGSEIESIYKTIYQSDGNEITLIDRVADRGSSGAGIVPECEWTDYEKEQLINHMVLKQILDELPENEKNLILLRYFRDQTQTQVAKEMGISQVQVSRIEKRILLRLREKIS